MSGDVKNNTKSSDSSDLPDNNDQEGQGSGYVNWWLFRDKGTIAEDWPTAEELWEDKSVQKEIEKVQKAFKPYKKRKK